MAAMVAETGHPFAPGGEPAEAQIAPIREQLPVAAPAEASILGNRELFGRLATDAMLAPMADVVRRWHPDLVVRDPCEYASAVLAADDGIPTAQCGISPAEVEWASIAVAQPALDVHRRGLADVVRSTPYATRFPATLDPSPFPVTVRFREAGTASPKPLPAWWGADDRPLVYATLGTVLGHMARAVDTFGVVLEAVAGLDARVLLTVGRVVEITALGPLPAAVHVEPWVDQNDVLAEAEVVVCHGGSGTTMGALRAGVPLVVVPQFADQFVNAERVVACGAGLEVSAARGDGRDRRPLEAADVARIRDALDTVRGDDRFRRAAGDVAAEMASAPTVDDVLDDLLRRRG
jgi:UDP:flavonoid glycosyltransferase YjiC (YdhE family)